MKLAPVTTPRPAVRDWSRVIPVKDAAARLDVSVDTLTRRCTAELAGRGLAFFDRPEGGGKSQWFVHRSYDPLLQPSLIADRYAESDLSRFNKKQRETAYARRHCVLQLAEWERTRPDLTIRQIVEHVIVFAGQRFPTLKISKTSLYAWKARCKHPCDLIKLVDVRGGDRRSQGSPEAWAEFRRLFLNDHKPTVREVWKLVRGVASDHKWAWCSYRSCLSQVDKRIMPQDQTKYRQPAKYRSSLAPFIEQHEDRFEAGGCWMSDHKQLDLICTHRNQKIRPWLTAWMDARTRKIVGWVLTTSPNSHTILAALRRAILNDPDGKGPPDQVWIDNGKDFAASVFHGSTKHERRVSFPTNEAQAVGIFDMLGVKAHFSLPYNPNGKGRLERFFRNLTPFARHFTGYCGTGIGDKPESLAALLNAPHKLPTFADVEARLGDFIAGYNGNAEHDMADLSEGGAALSPADAYSRWRTTARKYDAAALDLCLEMWSRPVRVGRNGITIAIRGKSVRYGQFDPMLAPFKNAKGSERPTLFVSYDSADVRQVKAWTHDMRFVATVRMNGMGGTAADPISADVLADLLSRQRSYNRSLATVNKHAYTQYLTHEEQIVLANVERLTPPPPVPADAMRIVPTPLDGEGRAVESEKRRMAVGAENQRQDDALTPSDWMNALDDAPPSRGKAPSFLTLMAEDE